MSFANLKKSSTSSIETLNKYIESKKSAFGADPRLWNVTVDKVGNGSAVIRFLPSVEGEEYPYVEIYDHGFKGPSGKWYIENSRTTLGESDPVSVLNSADYNSGDETRKKRAQDRSRRHAFIANILVISDPGAPENEGKVMLYKFGKKVFEKIESASKPAFPDEKPFNPFDFWTGANFKVRVYNNEGKQRQYDKCVFESPSALFDGDDKALEALWKKQYPLLAEIAPDKFKSYAELEAKLNDVLGISATGRADANRVETQRREVEEPAQAPTERRPASTQAAPAAAAASSGDDDDFAAYAALLKD